ncbi:hypothetical protein ACFFLZ_08755 [Photobacterium aphoticum]|uniref:Uncharacterized protein n=1 Tax=Photobacterium aphoticum TaxID=754436 RepID=A0A0J1GG89_9GAMM|nr:hypothetical protein [Photobacterium aphoticum]KLU98533.1 hypothetical protein ABT58_22325 [Photobacterium aphoticum]PSU54513.1 hypothetical protein C9I90_20305 [Photobacterium aphoticum]
MLSLHGALTVDVGADSLLIQADDQTVTVQLTEPSHLLHLVRLWRQPHIKALLARGRSTVKTKEPARAFQEQLAAYTFVLTVPSRASLTLALHPSRRWFPFLLYTQQKGYWLKHLSWLCWQSLNLRVPKSGK